MNQPTSTILREENIPMSTATWLPVDFVAPGGVTMPHTDHHLRPIHPDDTDLDMVAVKGSQERLWSIYGEAWGWPTTTITADADREDLAMHADEMTRNESFNYALFPNDESALVGCVYIDPPERVGADAEISWWVVDHLVGSRLEATLDDLVPRWIAADWPLQAPRYVGRDLSWAEWLELTPLPVG